MKLLAAVLKELTILARGSCPGCAPSEHPGTEVLRPPAVGRGLFTLLSFRAIYIGFQIISYDIIQMILRKKAWTRAPSGLIEFMERCTSGTARAIENGLS
jgi:hypothetical protein